LTKTSSNSNQVRNCNFKSKTARRSTQTYKVTLNALSHVPDVNRRIQSLSYKNLMPAEEAVVSDRAKANAVGVYFRTLRADCNKALLQKLAPLACYPFKKFKSKKEKTTARALT